MFITEEVFKKTCGRKPIQDELIRVNCPRVGEVGHFLCGMCQEHNKPRFECGCIEVKD